MTFIVSFLMSSSYVKHVLGIIPPVVKTILKSIYPEDLFLFVLFHFTYKRILRFSHNVQILLWSFLLLGKPYEFNKSILGFAEKRGGLFSKLLGGNYIARIVIMLLNKLGFHIRPEFSVLMSSVSYTLYFSQCIDIFKQQFLPTFFPK